MAGRPGRLCTGCEAYVYEADEPGLPPAPCPNCFPGLTRDALLDTIDRIIDDVVAEKEAGTLPALTDDERAILDGIMGDFFAFQAAACMGSPDCTCGRPGDHWAHRPR